MYISKTRHEREKHEIIGACSRLTDAILKNIAQGVFLLDAKDKIVPPASQSLASLFRRRDFQNLTFDKLLMPIVTPKTLSVARNHLKLLRASAPGTDDEATHSLSDVEVRLANADGSFDTARYAFDFSPLNNPSEPGVWMVHVTDVTARLQQQRELDDLRCRSQAQAAILHSVFQIGVPRFAEALQRTDGAMTQINVILKKSAREDTAFRRKLEEALPEVDRVRREAAALHLEALEAAARALEQALHELGTRSSLSGGDFLPIAVMLDDLFGEFVLVRSLGAQRAQRQAAQGPSGPAPGSADRALDLPRLNFEADEPGVLPNPRRTSAAGSLENTFVALAEHVAQAHGKTIALECTGLEAVPPAYQSAVKNMGIQLINNAIVHGIETPAQRRRAGKSAHGTVNLRFIASAAGYELLLTDDGRGLDPDLVRRTAVDKGLIASEEAAKLRDRQAIKLIFKSGFTTLQAASGEARHGAGLSLVRRCAHQFKGKIALASQPGLETRMKITLPALPAEPAQSEAQVA